MDPPLLADAMLGRLARWLRVLGCDTVCDPVAPDAELVRRAQAEGRVLLTRDRRLLRELRPARALEIESDVPLEQLAQVVAALGLEPPAGLFTRCLLCNAELEEVPEADRARLVPAGSRAVPGPVRQCPCCRRVYWPGSHVRRMREALDRALPGWVAPAR
jgi:uncharacterized protein with PIN domain